MSKIKIKRREFNYPDEIGGVIEEAYKLSGKEMVVDNPQTRIIVTVESGMVQHVGKVPEGVIIEVHCFDLHPNDIEALECYIYETPEGRKFIKTVWI